MSRALNLLPSSSREAQSFERSNEPVPVEWFAREGNRPTNEVIFCGDVLNNRYRFLIDNNGHIVPPDVSPGDAYPTMGEAPWEIDPRLWAPN